MLIVGNPQGLLLMFKETQILKRIFKGRVLKGLTIQVVKALFSRTVNHPVDPASRLVPLWGKRLSACGTNPGTRMSVVVEGKAAVLCLSINDSVLITVPGRSFSSGS